MTQSLITWAMIRKSKKEVEDVDDNQDEAVKIHEDDDGTVGEMDDDDQEDEEEEDD